MSYYPEPDILNTDVNNLDNKINSNKVWRKRLRIRYMTLVV